MSNFRNWKTFFSNSNQVKPALVFTVTQTQQRKTTRNGKIDYSVFKTKDTSESKSGAELHSASTFHEGAEAESIDRKRERITRTWLTRRNGICTEIEKTIFVEGNSLNRLHNNLKVTKKLERKGLLLWIAKTLVPQELKINENAWKKGLLLWIAMTLVRQELESNENAWEKKDCCFELQWRWFLKLKFPQVPVSFSQKLKEI